MAQKKTGLIEQYLLRVGHLKLKTGTILDNVLCVEADKVKEFFTFLHWDDRLFIPFSDIEGFHRSAPVIRNMVPKSELNGDNDEF